MKDIAVKVPIDKTSALVTGKGEHWEPNKKIQVVESDTLMPTRPVMGGDDLTGKRRGRLTVIGLCAERRGRWVAKCDCGKYVLRKAKSINNEENVQDRCEHCRELAFLKREDVYRRTGKHVDIRNF